MISQKTFIAILLSGFISASSSIAASASDETRYPPIQGGQANAATATGPGPASAGAMRQQYPPQQYPQQYPQRQYSSQMPPMGAYRGPAPYGRPAPYAGGAPYGPSPMPYGARPGPWNNGGWNRGPYGNSGPFGNMFGGNRGPYGNNGPFGNMFGGNRGPYGNSGPFGNMFGGRDGIWGMHPDEWFTSNPEDGFSYMWDDMINAPSEMGEMPGGWNAPSISVPNPVDVGSEFRRETPNLIREIPDMINVQ